MEKADLNKNDFHFHSLRHAHVAYLLSQGVDLTIISKRLGHADTTVTSKVYAYLVEEYKDKAENQIEKYLENIWKKEPWCTKDVQESSNPLI